MAPPLPFEVGLAPLPAGARATTEFEVSAYYISAGAEAPQACWEWITFLAGRPETTGALPGRRSVAASELWQEQVGKARLPALQATLDYEHTSLFGKRWEIAWFAYIYPWLYEAYQEGAAGGDVEAALIESQTRVETLVACLGPGPAFPGPDQIATCVQQADPDYPVGDLTPH